MISATPPGSPAKMRQTSAIFAASQHRTPYRQSQRLKTPECAPPILTAGRLFRLSLQSGPPGAASQRRRWKKRFRGDPVVFGSMYGTPIARETVCWTKAAPVVFPEMSDRR